MNYGQTDMVFEIVFNIWILTVAHGDMKQNLKSQKPKVHRLSKYASRILRNI